MVDANTKVKRLLKKAVKPLDQSEEDFPNRFTKGDDEFIAHCKKPFSEPPIIENWFSAGGNGGGRSGYYQHTNHYHSGGNYRNNYLINRNWKGCGGEEKGGGGGAGVQEFRRGRGGFRGQNLHHMTPYERPSGSGSRGGFKATLGRGQQLQNATKSINEIRKGYSNFVAASKKDNEGKEEDAKSLHHVFYGSS